MRTAAGFRWVWAVAAVVALGCGAETGGSAVGDTTGDVAGDTANDSAASDTASDSAAGDTASDAASDTASDAASDSADAAIDTTSDAGADTGEADTSEPDTSDPDTSEPDATDPDTSEPDATEPDTTVPDSASDVASGDASADAGGPPPGCCEQPSDCGADAVCFDGPFKAGKCMSTLGLQPGQCWSDAQCGKGSSCQGGMACGCKAFCKAMDVPGTCSKPAGGACSVGTGNDVPCGAGDFCALPSGCSGSGTCTPKPEGCAALYDPVCGCDGKTHGNACGAASAGVNVASKGECPAENKCLTVKCGDGNSCTDDTCDPATGQCNYQPVAGVPCEDGNACTSGDACVQEGAKAYCKAGGPLQCPPPAPCQLVSCNPKSGQCETTNDPNCGGGGKCSIGMGAPTIDCGADGYCKLDGGNCTGFGLCAKKPQACMAVVAPVCGCDGKTYGNDCEAGANGQNFGGKGECGPGGDGCCKQDGDCKTGVCANTSCKDPGELKPGMCWTDSQCGGGKCVEANVCPCGAACFAPDSPGKCAN